jgi:transmembrane sensor
MSTSEQRVHGLIAEEAADWFIENREGLDPEQRSQFIAWLKASPVHVEEYLAITALARDMPAACARGAESLDELVVTARLDENSTLRALKPHTAAVGRAVHPRRWQPLAVAASLSALGVGVLTLGHYWQGSHPSVASDSTALHFQTRHGQQRTYRLSDSSVVHLNTDTAVTIRFDHQERLLVLEAGEAAFEVTHEPARPFRVSAGSVQVVDIGTQFDVRVEPSETIVTVTEGRVNVGPTSNNRMPTLELNAGQQIRVVDGDWPARPVLIDARQITAWLRHQIKFDNEPLARVTSEFNRYAPTPFEIETPALQSMKISGVFSTDDTKTFIAFLRTLPRIHVEVTATRIRVSQH